MSLMRIFQTNAYRKHQRILNNVLNGSFCQNVGGGIQKRSFICTVRPTVHTNPSRRKRSFPKTLFKPEELENALFSDHTKTKSLRHFVFVWTQWRNDNYVMTGDCLACENSCLCSLPAQNVTRAGSEEGRLFL